MHIFSLWLIYICTSNFWSMNIGGFLFLNKHFSEQIWCFDFFSCDISIFHWSLNFETIKTCCKCLDTGFLQIQNTTTQPRTPKSIPACNSSGGCKHSAHCILQQFLIPNLRRSRIEIKTKQEKQTTKFGTKMETCLKNQSTQIDMILSSFQTSFLWEYFVESCLAFQTPSVFAHQLCLAELALR